MLNKIYDKLHRKKLKLFFFISPPLFFLFIWSASEFREIYSFNSIEIGNSNHVVAANELNAIQAIADSFYESTKDSFPIQYIENKQISEFELKISETATEKIGVFAFLPIHKVCLSNNNVIFVNGEQDNSQPSNIGGLAIKQNDGYNFYAQRGNKDCESVIIDKFEQSTSTQELSYPIIYFTYLEENLFGLGLLKFSTIMATTSVDTKNSRITISLSLWVCVVAYFVFLFVWSFIYFQFEKILKYIIE